jgi:hypothetical protein
LVEDATVDKPVSADDQGIAVVGQAMGPWFKLATKADT